MSSTLFPFIAKVSAPRALFTPQIRYGKPPPNARGLCAAVVRAGRNEQNPLLYNLAAGHYSDGGLPVSISERSPFAPFEPYDSRMQHEGQEELLSDENKESLDQGQQESQERPSKDQKNSDQVGEDTLDFDIDSILEGVRRGTISSVSPAIEQDLLYIKPQNYKASLNEAKAQDSNAKKSMSNAPSSAISDNAHVTQASAPILGDINLVSHDKSLAQDLPQAQDHDLPQPKAHGLAHNMDQALSQASSQGHASSWEQASTQKRAHDIGLGKIQGTDKAQSQGSMAGHEQDASKEQAYNHEQSLALAQGQSVAHGEPMAKSQPLAQGDPMAHGESQNKGMRAAASKERSASSGSERNAWRSTAQSEGRNAEQSAEHGAFVGEGRGASGSASEKLAHGAHANKVLNTRMRPLISAIRHHSDLSGELLKIIEITAEEKAFGNEYRTKVKNTLIDRSKFIAQNLIAFSGLQALKAHLNATREDYLQQSNNGSKGIGLVVFDHLEPLYIHLICTRLYSLQQTNFNKMLADLGTKDINLEPKSNVLPSPFRTEQDKGLGRDFKRVNTFVKWINQASEDSYERLDTVHMAIPRHTIKDLDNANSNLYVDRINRAIHWRDHNNDSGQIVLSAVNSDDIQASMEGVPSIKNDDLINSMLEHLDQFFAQNKDTYGLKEYQVKSTRDPLKTTLSILHNNSDFSFSLFDLALYTALCWIYYSEVDDMPQSLGMAMPMLNLPRQDNLFKNPSVKNVSEKSYGTIISNKGACSLCYRSGYDPSGESLKIKTLIKNLYEQFTWPSKVEGLLDPRFNSLLSEDINQASKASQNHDLGHSKDKADGHDMGQSSPLDLKKSNGALDKDELIELNHYEICIIKNYLNALLADAHQDLLDSSYNFLCFIEWQNKLQKLFVASVNNKTETKPLSERTREHFENELKNGVEPLSDEENEILELCDKQSNLRTPQDLSALIGFYTNRQFVIQVSPSLNKAWEKILFAQESYEHENFLLALTQALLYVMKNADHKNKLKNVCLELPMSYSDITKFNSNVLRNFSLYFGSALQALTMRSHGFIKIVYAGVAQDKAQNKPDINPVINFNAFQQARKFKNCHTTSKAATTLKFKLTPYYEDDSKGESLQLYWSTNPNQFSYSLFKDISNVGKSSVFQYSSYDRTVEVQSSALPALDIYSVNSFSFVPITRDCTVFTPKPIDTHNLSKLINCVLARASDDVGFEIQKLTKVIEIKENQEKSKDSAKGQSDATLAGHSCESEQATLLELDQCYQELHSISNDIKALHNLYFACLHNFLAGNLNCDNTTYLSTLYSGIQNRLMSAPLSHNKLTKRYAKELLELLVMIGMSYEGEVLSNDLGRYLENSLVYDRESNLPENNQTALATPLCIESLHSLCMKNERLVGLMCSIIKGQVKLNNQPLFIDHLCSDINYPDNAEHYVRFNRMANQYGSLLSYQNSLGYTLYQSALAYQERFNRSMPNTLSSNHLRTQNRVSKNASISSYNSLISHYQQDYLNEVGDYIEHYLKSRPYLMEQCSIMIYYCGVVDLIVAIYRYLEQNHALSKVKFNLIIVNCNLQESKLIYQAFEQEKALRSKRNIDGSFIQRIVVNVLTTDSKVHQNAGSNFNYFLNQERLSLNSGDEQSSLAKMMQGTEENINKPSSYHNLKELSRIADICLMFHIFDAHTSCKFSRNNVNVPIIINDKEYQPSLINFSNYQELITADRNLLSTRSLTNHLGKYLVCPILTLSRAQTQHSFYYLAKEDLSLFNQARDNLNDIITNKLKLVCAPNQGTSSSAQGNAPSFAQDGVQSTSLQEQGNLDDMTLVQGSLLPNVPMAGVPLFEQALSDNSALHQESINSIIKQVHSRADVVIYFDEIMSRLMLIQNDIDVVYYHKLRNFALNFMVASNSTDQHSMYNLKELLSLLKVTNDFEGACHKVRRDAIAISGSILLRAETKRIHVYEMMGLVLSKYLGNDIFLNLAQGFTGRALLNEPTYVSLDDYCAIFGKKNQLRADILGLQLYERPTTDLTSQKRYILCVVVLESKFFEKPNEKAASKSLSQTQSSTQNFYNVLCPSQDAISDERTMWLSRIADMLLTNANFAHHLNYRDNSNESLLRISADEFVQVQELLRNGEIDIMLKGISLVYAHSQEEVTYSKLKAKSASTLGPGAHNEQVDFQLSTGKDKYPVIQIKIYQDALTKILKAYFKDSQDQALKYLISRDKSKILSSYLEREDSLKDRTSSKFGITYHYTYAQAPEPQPAEPQATEPQAPASEQSDPKGSEHSEYLAKEEAEPKISEHAQPMDNADPMAQAKAELETNGYSQEESIAKSKAPTLQQLNESSVPEKQDDSFKSELTNATSARTHKLNESHTTDDIQASGVINEQGTVFNDAYNKEQDSLYVPEHENKTTNNQELEDAYEQEQAIDKQLNSANELVSEQILANDNELSQTNAELSQSKPDKDNSAPSKLEKDSSNAFETVSKESFDDKSIDDHVSLDMNLAFANSNLADNTNTSKELMELGEHKVDDPFTHDLLDSEEASMTSIYTAMPVLNHNGNEYNNKVPVSHEISSNAPILSDNHNSKLDNFWETHKNVYDLVKSSEENVDFSKPTTIRFVHDTMENLIYGFTKLGLNPQLKSSKVTANGAIFSFEGNDNFDVAKINKVKSALMTSYGPEIYKIVPKSRQIDIFVKAREPITIPYLSLLAQREFNYDYYEHNGVKTQGYNTKFILGLGDDTGDIVYLDYRKESPHTLVAGTTGSGKSVLLNCIILDMAITNSPDELELILVDPKRGVEFGPFDRLPHLHNQGIIIEKEDALEKLNELVEIMEHRADEFTALTSIIQSNNTSNYAYIRDIDSYNLQCIAYGKERMKHIVFIMDEFADWFIDKQFKDNATGCLQRLAQKGRFSGINVIFATQRPDSKLMDSNVKAQLYNRIALKTTDKINSKIILDDTRYDASLLNGKGHMICRLADMQHAQSGFVSSKLVDSLVHAICLDYQASKSKK